MGSLSTTNSNWFPRWFPRQLDGFFINNVNFLFFICSSIIQTEESMCSFRTNMFWFLLYLLIFLINSSYLASGQSFDYPIANISTSWTNNNVSITHSVQFIDRSMVRSILLRGSFGPRFACGFYCNGDCSSFVFAVFIVQTNSASLITSPAIGFPQVVWSANRNNPVRENATLQLTQEGDLILRDVDGTRIWSTNTTRKSVAGLSMNETGNLVLFDGNNQTVWQSFDHPTDALVPGQTLAAGQKLTANMSTLNWTAGPISLSVTTQGLFAYIDSDPQQFYSQRGILGPKDNRKPSYVKFLNGSLALFILSSEPNQPDSVIPVPAASSMQYLKLESDGHLRVYEWSSGWKEVADLLTGFLGDCNYPMVCGKYGLCSNGQCSCPEVPMGETSYFRQLNARQPNLGCSEITPLSCEALENHQLLDLKDVTYFYYPANITNTNLESCKEACLKNCSCKAAFFQYGFNDSNGNCFMPTEVFSLMTNEKDKTHYNSSAFIKVQNSQVAPSPSPSTKTKTKTNRTAIILGSTLGGIFGVFLIVSISYFLFRKKRDAERDEEDYLDQVPGMPTRLCYEELKVATNDFVTKLGQGGFGSVFQGTLFNGTEIAVKCLDGIGQVKKSFLAEVMTIGSIHHVNLVRLVGFCADKSHRLLVYEYMCNGSLDKWIFNSNEELTLSWKIRKKVILDIAKGLAYLHEECRQTILHLDIKPQNILLDDNFNAKVSDFGLSKLIDRDQIEVVTTMRGTPGYLAPEWLNSVITEKVDVYSFGVVVMEIVCGRKNLDRSQSEEYMHLLGLLKRKAEEEQLLDLVDKHNKDMQLHREEALEMIKVATWCLQSDYSKRPSMSVVVKVLEGVMEVESNLDYSFSTPLSSTTVLDKKEMQFGASTPLLPSVLSGPR